MKYEDLDLYSLKYFFDAVENNSLTRSAELNHVTRSAISQSLQRLESWCGKQLITHEKKVFQLTYDGESFYRTMKKASSTFQKEIRDSKHINLLKIGCSNSLSESFLLPTLKNMKSLESLHLKIGSTATLNQMLDDGQINIALFITEKNRTLKNEIVLHHGLFSLASRHGQITEKIIVTEDRPEVAAAKKILLKRRPSPFFYIVESWTLAAKLAFETNQTALLPDCLLEHHSLKKIALRNYQSEYKVVLRHNPRWQLCETEVLFIERLQNAFIR